VALHNGTPPLLQYPGVSGDQVYAVFGSSRKHSRLAELRPDSGLECIAADVSTVADFLNAETKQRKLDPAAYQDLVIDLGYRLLESRPPCGSQGHDTLQAALHLALTAFMTTFVLQFGHQRRIRFNDLSVRLKHSLRGSWASEPGNTSFLLWALIVGGISEFGPTDYSWLLPGIRQTAGELGIRGWESILHVLSQYPWVSVLHDVAARRLWHLLRAF